MKKNVSHIQQILHFWDKTFHRMLKNKTQNTLPKYFGCNHRRIWNKAKLLLDSSPFSVKRYWVMQQGRCLLLNSVKKTKSSNGQISASRHSDHRSKIKVESCSFYHLTEQTPWIRKPPMKQWPEFWQRMSALFFLLFKTYQNVIKIVAALSVNAWHLYLQWPVSHNIYWGGRSRYIPIISRWSIFFVPTFNEIK